MTQTVRLLGARARTVSRCGELVMFPTPEADPGAAREALNGRATAVQMALQGRPRSLLEFVEAGEQIVRRG